MREIFYVSLSEAKPVGLAPVDPCEDTELEVVEPGEEGSLWEVTVIKAGVSSNGNLYTKDVLAEACTLFEGAPVGLYRFTQNADNTWPEDHVPEEVRTVCPGVVLNVAGWLENVRMAGDEMVANLRVTSEWLRSQLLVREAANGPQLELSIEAKGPVERMSMPDGKVIRKVLRIAEAVELTVVTKASAGGKFKRRLVESHGPQDGLEVHFGGGKFHVLQSHNLLASYKTSQEAFEFVSNMRGKSMDNEKEVEVAVEEVAPPQTPEEAPEEISEISSGEEGVIEQVVETSTTEVTQEDSVVVAEETQTSPDYTVAESPKVRQVLVRALRALGFADSLEESTTSEIISCLQGQINEYSTKESALAESLQQSLMEVLASLQRGDLSKATAVLESLVSTMVTSTQPKVKESEPKMPDQDKDQTLTESQAALIESHQALLETVLEGSALPESAKNILRKQYPGKVDVKALKEDIQDIKSMLNEQIPSTKAAGNSIPVQGTAPVIQMGHHRLDRLKAEARVMMGYDPSKDSSLKESDKELYKGMPNMPSLKDWYVRATDDQEVSFQKHGPNSVFREATTASLPDIFGDALNRSLVQRYAEEDKTWQTLAEVKTAKDFRSIKRLYQGGLGVLPTVAESDSADTYERLGIGGDEKTEYTASTVGGLIVITRKMIINDDLDALRRIPVEAASAANRLLQTRVVGAILGNADGGGINTDLSYDGYVIYHNNHRNLGTAALSYTSLFNSFNRLRSQRNYGNVGATGAAFAAAATNLQVSTAAFWEAVKVGDVLSIEAELVKVTAKPSSTNLTVTRGHAGTTDASHNTVGTRIEQLSHAIDVARDGMTFLYPFSLEKDAAAILNSEKVPESNNNNRNEFYAMVSTGRMRPMSLHEMYLNDDTNNFYLIAGKPVEVSFVQGQQAPAIIYQNAETDHTVLLRDNYTWKLRHEYGVGKVDHRRVDGNIVP